MPIAPDLWKSCIKAILERIADEDYQRHAWFNSGPEVSSPDELICQLLDDYLFDDFIASNDIALSEDQRSSARSYSEALLAFSKQTPDIRNPYKVIDNPRWRRLRDEAKLLLERLSL